MQDNIYSLLNQNVNISDEKISTENIQKITDIMSDKMFTFDLIKTYPFLPWNLKFLVTKKSFDYSVLSILFDNGHDIDNILYDLIIRNDFPMKIIDELFYLEWRKYAYILVLKKNFDIDMVYRHLDFEWPKAVIKYAENLITKKLTETKKKVRFEFVNPSSPNYINDFVLEFTKD